MLLTPIFTVLTSVLAVSAASHSRSKRHHPRNNEIAPPAEREVFTTTVNTTMSKRDGPFSGRGTFFYVGLGACGQYSKDSDYMVALNSAQYGGGYPGPNCFRYITIQANGVTVGGVEILDECPTCDYGGLDLSPGLFQRFADESAGVLSITWWWSDGSSDPTTTSTSTSTYQAPTTTWTPTTTSTTPAWTPTTTSTSQWVAPTTSTTSTYVAPTSTSSSSSSYIPSSSSSAPVSSSSAVVNATVNPFAVIQNSTATSSSILPSSSGNSTSSSTSTTTDSTTGNLVLLNGLVAQYGGIVVAGAGGHTV